MFDLRHRFAPVFAVAVALGLYACGGGVVLPDEGEAADIVVFAGDAQSGPAGAALDQALVVRVTDSDDRPVANQPVAFAVDAGGGQVSPASTTTNADGLASATWTLGAAAGTQRVRATATSSLTVSFTATALTGSAGVLELVSGDGQEGGVASALAEPLVVRVTDGLGNPVEGVTVTWSVGGGGSIDPPTSVTAADGTASAQRVLGPTAGVQTAQAAADGLAGSPVTFTHTADASTPTSLVRVSGDGQSAPAGFQLPDSLVVRLLDDNDNGVGGRTVTWVVPAGAGVMSPINAVTDPDGYAVTRWTLGPTVGRFTATAVFAGLRVDFSADATADVPTTVSLQSGNSQTGPVGAPLPQPLRVRVTDANGNPVENVSVVWTASGGASVSSTTSGTNSQGTAEVTLTLGAAPGTYNATATVDGLAGSPVTFTAIGEVGRAAQLVFTSQPANVVVGQTLPVLTVQIQDAQGNLVTNATNRVRITSSPTGALTGGGLRDPVGGIVTFDALVLNRADQGYTLTAGASGLTDATSNPFDVAPGETTIAITGDGPDPSVTGQQVTVGYDINITAPATGSLTGTVEVRDGDDVICTGGIIAATGVGSCTGGLPAAGARTVTATYSGTANFNSSTSAGVAHQVNPAQTQTTITGHAPDPSTAGATIAVNYSVTAAGPGGGAPTGNVVVTVDGGQPGETCTGTVADGTCDLPLSVVGANRVIRAAYAGDGNYAGSQGTVQHTVNSANATPNAVNDSYSVAEDGVLSVDAAGGVLANDTDDGPVSASVVVQPSDGTLILNSDGSFQYTPNPDFFGDDEFTYQASDGSLSDQATVTVTVTPVNDPPSFAKGGDEVVSALLVAIPGVTRDNWASQISAGLNEPQTVTFLVSTDNDGAFAELPEVSSSGALSYKPNGRLDTVVVTVTVTAQDSAGATSAPQTFTITINP